MKKELNGIISQFAFIGDRQVDVDRLMEHTHKVSAAGAFFRWSRVKVLYLLGMNLDEKTAHANRGIPSGIFADLTGEWVAVIGVDTRDVQEYLWRCSPKLEKLIIRYTDVNILKLNSLKGIRQLQVQCENSLEEIEGLDELDQLQYLVLERTALRHIHFSSRQSQLQSIHARDNAQLEQIHGVGLLENLSEIYLEKAAIRNFELHGSMRHLKTCVITSIPIENADFLRVPSYLHRVWLRDTNITNIPSLDSVRYLEELDLAGSPIETFEGAEFPVGLKRFNLSHTKIRCLPDSIIKLKKLEYLTISGLNLDSIPDWLPELGLPIRRRSIDGISLFGTTVAGVDMSIFDESQDKILLWFEARKHKKTEDVALLSQNVNLESGKVINKKNEIISIRDEGDKSLRNESRKDKSICSESRAQSIPTQSMQMARAQRNKLIQSIARSCAMLQDNRKIWDGTEDERTIYLRDLLVSRGYIVLDQHMAGSGKSGKQPGELDLDIRQVPDVYWTALEALNISGSSESQIQYWNEHLDKLLTRYNTPGRTFLFQLSYLSCVREKFIAHYMKYQDHIRRYSPAGFRVISARELEQIECERSGFTQIVECVYDCGGVVMTVYHFFVRIGE